MNENEDIPKFVQDLQKKSEQIIKNAKRFLIILFVLAFVRSVVVAPFRIPSGSMIPTLRIGDFILANKLAYGLVLPFYSFNGRFKYILTWAKPQVGDVVVFKHPVEHSLYYIKRVVAGPGDSVQIINKALFVNDKEVMKKEFKGSEISSSMDPQYKSIPFSFYKETNHKGKEYTVQYDESNFHMSDMKKRIIQKGKYFVMGDNRNFSQDSRSWGEVDQSAIIAKASVVWISFEYGPRSPIRIRTERFGITKF